MSIDWIKIKNEYITTNISYRKLAEKHKVSFNTLKGRAIKEQWRNEKEKTHHKITTKTQQKCVEAISDKNVEHIDKITSIADALLDKLEQATAELDRLVVKKKVKDKVVKKGEDGIVEHTTENEEFDVVEGALDRAGIKQLASALKDLNDIKANSSKQNELDKLDEVLNKIEGNI